MTIPTYAQTNFRTLLRAAADGNLALMECLDARTREPRYVLCAVGHDGTDRVFTPFGHLAFRGLFSARPQGSSRVSDTDPVAIHRASNSQRGKRNW
ncbi:DUF6117 family protein [Agrobacterium radiobacter]|uniref:DUF6117 family protein n=1 Tax=Agrobacterium radiobacter TaxID=362 RepID=UPI0017CF0515|nr:hypothetical protein [Agrobacterium radiobacter]